MNTKKIGQALAVCVAALWFVCIGMGLEMALEKGRSSLPYIEPHATWEDEDNTPCAGWLLDNGGAVSICEGKTIKVRWPKPKQGELDV